jgi:hypothetical protein
MPRTAPLLLTFFAAVPVTGCATGGEFPSLAPRAVEQLSFEEPVRVDPPVAADPALSGRANALLAEARTGERQFEEAYALALPAVRAAGPVGSDSWVQAQEAISRVEAARIGTSGALSDLDLLVAEQSDEPTNNAFWANLQAARQAAERLVADQRRRLDQLKSSVTLP